MISLNAFARVIRNQKIASSICPTRIAQPPIFLFFDTFAQLCNSEYMNTTQAKARADILKALAHPTRVLIVDALSRGDQCVTDLRRLASATLPTISRHLDKLKKAGIVTERREGPRVIHHLACPCMLQALDCAYGVLKSVKKRHGDNL